MGKVSQRGVPTGGGGSLRWIISRGSEETGRSNRTELDLSPPILNQRRLLSLRHTHTDTHRHTHRHTETLCSALCVGTRTRLFQSARKGRCHEAAGRGGSGGGEVDVPVYETRVGFKRALWAAEYCWTAGGVHRTASPLKTKSRSRPGLDRYCAEDTFNAKR